MDEIAYIYSYIKYVYSSVDELKEEGFALDIARRIKSSMPNSRFVDRKLDSIIRQFVYTEMITRNSKSFIKYDVLRRYIYTVVQNDNVIVELIRYIYAHPEEFTGDITTGVYDGKLKELASNGLNPSFVPLKEIPNAVIDLSHIMIDDDGNLTDDTEAIYDYVYQYLNNNSSIFDFNGDLRYLANIIGADIRRSGINGERLRAHRCDNVIDKFIRTGENGIRLKDRFLFMQEVVNRFVEDNNSFIDIEDKELNAIEEAFKITKQLYAEGFTVEDIKAGKCNNIMNKRLERDCLRVNSVKSRIKLTKSKKIPNKTFARIKEVTRTKAFKAACFIALLTILGIAKSKSNDTVEPPLEVVDYSALDSYEYKSSHSLDDAFTSNLNHIVDFYNKYTSYGEKYGQICLYKAYIVMDGYEYSSMDALCQALRERAKYDPTLSQLDEDIRVHYSYVFYVYSKLIEVDPSYKKYASAINAYNAQYANHREKNVVDVLKEKDPESLELLGQMMDDYAIYIHSLEVELSEAIEEGDKSVGGK